MEKRTLDIIMVGEVGNGVAEGIADVLDRFRDGYYSTMTIIFPHDPPIRYALREQGFWELSEGEKRE